ncbi:hypothetical protein ACV8VY_15020 [Citrobacter freundii]
MSNVLFLRTDNDVEVLKTMDHVLLYLDNIEDTYCWKWILTGWHSILQNVMVLALDNGNCFNVYLANANNRTLDIYNQIMQDDYRNVEKLNLPSFLSLFSGIHSETFYGSIYSPSQSCRESMGVINEIRNNFIHFQPAGTSLQVNNWPAMILATTEIIEHFISSNEIARWFDGAENEFLTKFRSIQNRLKILRDQYQ